MNNCWIIVVAIMVVIVIMIICKYQRAKCNFINGMWTNSAEDMYIYIDNIEKEGWKGAYIVSQKHDVNEPFKIKSKVGMIDDIKIETKKSKFLKKNMISKLNLADGVIEVCGKNNKKYKLYKDTETSNSLKTTSTKKK
tara:strand:- start:2172 stop:2585 length:414 start_codon:yes stop_codon:yes gene_type:complete